MKKWLFTHLKLVKRLKYVNRYIAMMDAWENQDRQIIRWKDTLYFEIDREIVIVIGREREIVIQIYIEIRSIYQVDKKNSQIEKQIDREIDR